MIAAARGDAASASRAQLLKEEVDPLVTRMATQDAAAFKPAPPGGYANQIPVL
jgi:hypothetical protein